MADTNIRELAQKFIDALHTLEQGSVSDVQSLVALYASDAVLANSALDSGGREMRGTEEITRFWTEYKEELGQVKSSFHHVTLGEDSAGLFWITEGKNPGGDEVNYHGATLLEFDDSGKIRAFRGYYDTRQLSIKAEVA